MGYAYAAGLSLTGQGFSTAACMDMSTEPPTSPAPCAPLQEVASGEVLRRRGLPHGHPLPSRCPLYVRQLVDRCCAADPRQRPAMAEVCEVLAARRCDPEWAEADTAAEGC